MEDNDKFFIQASEHYRSRLAARQLEVKETFLFLSFVLPFLGETLSYIKVCTIIIIIGTI